MKPRLRFIRGLWYCFDVSWLFGLGYTPSGLGYTPQAAYKDWQQLTNPDRSGGSAAQP